MLLYLDWIRSIGSWSTDLLVVLNEVKLYSHSPAHKIMDQYAAPTLKVINGRPRNLYRYLALSRRWSSMPHCSFSFLSHLLSFSAYPPLSHGLFLLSPGFRIALILAIIPIP